MCDNKLNYNIQNNYRITMIKKVKALHVFTHFKIIFNQNSNAYQRKF